MTAIPGGATSPSNAGTAQLPTCTAIIPTLGDRPSLQAVVGCLQRQTVAPESIMVSVGTDTPRPVWFPPENRRYLWLRPPQRGTAAQRNFAALMAEADILAFLDDDVSFADDLFEIVLSVFSGDTDQRIGAVSPRMVNSGHPKPSALLRTYYRWQAGYDDATYGARLFGYGLNAFPCYEVQKEAMISADWLNSPCLFVRRGNFEAVRFPDFHGYSFGEDAYLTAMMRKGGKQLFFLRDVQFEHHAGEGEYKADHFHLAQTKICNQGHIAREVLGLRGWRYWSRKVAHQCFVTLSLVRDRKQGWVRQMAGVWSA